MRSTTKWHNEKNAKQTLRHILWKNMDAKDNSKLPIPGWLSLIENKNAELKHPIQYVSS